MLTYLITPLIKYSSILLWWLFIQRRIPRGAFFLPEIRWLGYKERESNKNTCFAPKTLLLFAPFLTRKISRLLI